MTLIPERPPKKRLPNPTVSYRPPDEQSDWIETRRERGWKHADLLAEVVGMHIHLDRALEPYMEAVRAFAQKEGLSPRHDGDTLWLRESLARLMLRGLEVEGLVKPTKKGGK